MSDLLKRLADLSPEKRRLLEMRLQMARSETAGPVLGPRERGDAVPLSFAQQRLWLVDELEPGTGAYNVPVTLRLSGRLDVDALRRSLDALRERHESLRTTFGRVGDEPVQVIHPAAPADLDVADLSHLPRAEAEAAAARLAEQEAARGFDLRVGPLLRVGLVRVAADEHLLLVNMHHIVSDGWSMGVFTRELQALYTAFVSGAQSPLPPPELQYADFALWQREWMVGETLERLLAYWRGNLAGAPPVLELPTDRPRPPVESHRGAVVPVEVPAPVAERLRALAREEGATLFAVLLAGVKTVLSRHAGQDDVVVGTAVANRSRSQTEGLVGFFVNTVALRTDVSGDPTFRQMVGRVKDTTLGAFQHQDLPFERLVEELKTERDLSRNPVFQVMFALQNAPGPDLVLPGLTLTEVEVNHRAAKFDLSIELTEREDGAIRGSVDFAVDLFDEATVERLAEHLRVVLQAAVARPDARLSTLPMMSAGEEAALRAEWATVPAEYPGDRCFHELVAETAARTPDAPALLHGDETISYAELEARANRMANHLRGLGVVPESRVALALDRSAELVVGILGTMKAGAAYVPLDPAYPADRLAYMLQDSGAVVVVTLERHAHLFAGRGARLVRMDVDRAALEAESAEAPAVAADPSSAAYVIYTSGTTGQPKGVVAHHRGLVNSASAQRDLFGITPADRGILLFSPSFDASLFDVAPPLLAGASLRLAPADDVHPGPDLPGRLRGWGVTMLTTTPSTLAAIPVEALPDVRLIFSGGERLPGELVERWGQGRRFVNIYGPTEATVWATWEEVRPGCGGSPPIGRPLPNGSAYVLDRWLNLCAPGVPGELYLGGAGVTRGYHRRPGITAERFVPDPFSAEPGARLYRTGDRVRRRRDGRLDFMGRVDQQVKIRGYRVEVGEVESALASHPAVKEAVVLFRQDGPGGGRLVGYAVPSDQHAATGPAIRAWLQGVLPAYMVPAAVVVLDAMPVNENGKVETRLLPVPDLEAAAEGFVAPRTPTEEVLAGTWAEVLRVERVGVGDNFFELGGHSLLATRVISRIRQLFRIELPVRAIFEAPTVRELAVRVDGSRQDVEDLLPPIHPAGCDGDLPTSFAQERMWFLDRMEPGSSTYNMPVALEMRGALDAAALRSALTEVVRRHESLRTVFVELDEALVQRVAPAGEVPLEVVDLGGGDDAAVDAAVAEAALRPFDLATGPLFRATLVRAGEERHVLVMAMHHIVSDGWSLGILFGELAALYGAAARGTEAGLPPVTVQYGDYAVRQRRHLSGERLEKQARYWRERLAGVPATLELPTDHPRPPVRSFRGEVHDFVLPPDLSAQVRDLSRREGSTLFMTLLAAFQVLLARYAGQDDVVVGTPIAGRTDDETERLVGLFVNTLVLRADLAGDPSFRELLAQVRDTTLGAYAHQELPFEKLVEELGVERSLSHSPVFQVMFAMQNAVQEGIELPGLQVSGRDFGWRSSKFDLTLNVGEAGGAIAGSFEFATDLFDAATVQRMAEHYTVLLRAAVAAPDARVGALPMASEEERRRVLVEWNRTDEEVPQLPVHHLFARQAARTPHAEALVYEDRSMTFAELEAASNRVARHLRSRGVGPEVRVGIFLERSPEMVVSILGVLKAGGAYVPFDPAYPSERLAYTMEDAGIAFLLAHAAIAASVPATSVPVVTWEEVEAASAAEPAEDPGVALDVENLAYVIYTSGSTGRPKGVLVSHRGLPSLVLAKRRAWEKAAGDRVLQFAALAFDATVAEIFGALVNGAALVLAPREKLLPGPDLLETMRRQRITLLTLPPSVLAALTPADLPHLRAVVTGGEACTAEVVTRWAPGRRMVNVYGPTETTVAATAAVCRADGRRPSIGVANGNTRLYVLDSAMRPVPLGAAGELYVGGPGVARGYHGRPGITAERFVPDPFGDEPGARIYRTGDRVRWRGDAEVDYLGRLDDQVKIRGFRVELGEVQAALSAHPDVTGAVVVVREDVPGDARLVGYVVSAGDPAEVLASVRSAAQRALPDYMVPAVVVLDRLPMTPNGKVDRRALPAPEREGSGEEGYMAPRTQAEQVMAGIWAQVLHLDRVGVTESFFELGGHSLLATRVVSRVRQLLGVDLPVRAVFEAPTVRELAARVEAHLQSSGEVLPPIVATGRDGDVPLSFAQERMWFIDQMHPGTATYNIPTALELRGELDLPALRAALAGLSARHESLRTTFVDVDDAPVQRIAPAGEVPIEAVDLHGAGEEALDAAVTAEAQRPFDLATGPLFRATLFRVAAERHVLVLSLHHIVSDGWSMGVLFRELGELYAAAREGRPAELPPVQVQYADYAAWQRRHLSGERIDRQARYWRERLAGAPATLELPTDRPRPPLQSFRGDLRSFALPERTAARLGELARAEGATLFMVTLAAFQALLGRYARQADVVVGTPIAGRERVETEGLIGLFVNTLVLRADLSADPTFRELLAQVRETTLGAYAHQELPFERLVEELEVERTQSHAPLFQVMFTLQNADAGAAGELPGLEVAPRDFRWASSKFDLTLNLEETGGRVAGTFEFATDLFDGATIERMAEHYAALLEGVAADPDRRVSRVEILRDEERALVLEGANAAARRPAYDVETPVHERVQARAAETPDAPAVVHHGATLSYAELNARANRLARWLRSRGVGPDVRVAVLMERSADLVVATLAVWKAGGAYVPLDAAYPAERVAFVLQDTRVPVLLTHERHASRLPVGEVEVFRMDADWDRVRAEPAEDLPTVSLPESLAYLIYTSGSTGVPKGVEVEHRTLANLVRWHHEAYAVSTADRGTQVASSGFDAWAWEVWPVLAAGASLHVVDDLLRSDPRSLLGWLVEHEITVSFLPTPLAEALLRLPWRPETRLRLMLVGGDRLRVRPPAGLPFTVANNYGPTECTVVATSATVEPREEGAAFPNIGGPIGNVRAYVLDAALRPVPLGVPGELVLGGGQLARGYHARPGTTAAAYLPDPFSAEPGARMYRTGDLARLLPSGEIECLGRLDHQVKIRGHRLEIGEVEAVLGKAPGVDECAVTVREDRGGQGRLVAYYVPGAAAPTVPALRAFLRDRLPEYMVPSAWVRLDAMPQTTNGKVDKRALPAPDDSGPRDAYVASRTPTEQILSDVWAEVLGAGRVGIRDNFFELGGHSLLATQVMSRVRAALQVELPLRVLFEAATVETMAERVDAARRAAQGLPEVPLLPASRDGDLPLSFSQERLWFIERLQPGTALYNVPTGMRIGGALDPGALHRALAEIVRRHEALRTVFRRTPGGPVQVVLPAGELPLPFTDLSGHADRHRESERLARLDATTGFDVENGPLIRFQLLRLAADDHLLLMNMHHVVSDGWSMKVFFGELSALYAAFRDGLGSPLEEMPLQYPDYAVWQREWMRGPVVEAQLDYWRKKLGGTATLQLPTDRPRPALQTHRGSHHTFTLSQTLSEDVKSLARREGSTLFMTLLAAFKVLLWRYAGQEDVVVGTPIAGRTRPELESMIGLFLNTLALRTDVGGDPDFRELLRRVKETTLDAYAHQDLPFEKLVEELGVERSLSHHPLFQVSFSLHNEPESTPRIGDLSVGIYEASSGTSKFDLSMSLTEADGSLVGGVEFAEDLFDRSTIERMTEHFRALLEGIVAAPDQRLSELPSVLDAEELHRLLVEWNRTGAEYPQGLAHQVFARRAAETPDAEALVFEDRSMTYAELDAAANRLARHLRSRGVGPEARVGIFLERSLELVVSILAVVKAGGAYVPFDPAYPSDRLAYTLEDAGIAFVLAHGHLVDTLPTTSVRVVTWEEAEAASASESAEDPAVHVDPDNLAYVLYTSGSTGKPKGVLVTHRGIPSLSAAARRLQDIRPGDRVLQFAALAFDVTVWEVWGTLLNGAALVLAPRERLLPGSGLLGTLRRQRISSVMLPPSVMSAMAPDGLPDLRTVCPAGEACSAEVVTRWAGDGRRVVNAYGPTECTVVTVSGEIPADGRRPTIGRPVENTRAYVLDEEMQPVATRVAGELYLGGIGVGRGYHGKAGITAERFVPDPFSPEPGARIYRTGDRVRWRADGELDYLGRLDDQVKVRGFRVELGEVEAALGTHPGVDETAVVVRKDLAGGPRLVGYVVPVAGAALSAPELREHLQARLPDYMVPQAFVVMDVFPLTPNGKVDRRALPAPELGAGEGFVAPQGELERKVAAIWEELLGVPTVGVNDNFFEIGGHSLLMAQLQERLREAFGREVPMVDLFQHPTVSALARHLDAAERPAAKAVEQEKATGRGSARREMLRRRPR